METASYIESGILELYVFGVLTETENNEIATLANTNVDIQNEIMAIEKAITSLSFSMSPHLSAENYDRIKSKILSKDQAILHLQPRSNIVQYTGWAATILMMIGAAYFYNQSQISEKTISNIEQKNFNLNTKLKKLEIKKLQSDAVLAIVRDENATIVKLEGQSIAPKAKSKIYWNQNTKIVYVDASELPEPPVGMEYQVWSLKLSPSLVPTSLGTLTNFEENDSKFFAVANTAGAEAFGITLEPKGGSLSPTMEQLYTLGKV